MISLSHTETADLNNLYKPVQKTCKSFKHANTQTAVFQLPALTTLNDFSSTTILYKSTAASRQYFCQNCYYVQEKKQLHRQWGLSDASLRRTMDKNTIFNIVIHTFNHVHSYKHDSCVFCQSLSSTASQRLRTVIYFMYLYYGTNLKSCRTLGLEFYRGLFTWSGTWTCQF